jgi:hypothetical protein
MKFAGKFSKQGDVTAPTTSIVMIHGNKMAHIDPRMTMIIDLDRQTLTNINTENRSIPLQRSLNLKMR